MGALKPVFAAVGLLACAPAHADEIERWRPLIAEASMRFGVPVVWIERVMSAESRGRTTLGGKPITSPAGAMGLMQLMPGTWASMRSQFDLGRDPHDPRDNILAGTAYLRLMYDQFGYPGLFAAYNAGPARYAKYLAGSRRLPAETRLYLAATTGTGSPTISPASGQPRVAQTIFFNVSARQSPPPSSASIQPPTLSPIFIALGGAGGRKDGE